MMYYKNLSTALIIALTFMPFKKWASDLILQEERKEYSHLKSDTILDPFLIAQDFITLNKTYPSSTSKVCASTENQFGYVFLIPSPVAQDFAAQEDINTKHLLEIGAGFCNTSALALQNGVKRITINDLDPRHLEHLVYELIQNYPIEYTNYFKKINLIAGKAPDILFQSTECFDSILLDKVFHFFNPQDIQDFFNWTKIGLKENGTVYILTIAPTIPSMRDHVLDLYTKQKLAGALFPGYFIDSNNMMAKEAQDRCPAYAIPDQMIFFTLEDLTVLFEKNGFEILKQYSVTLPTETEPLWIQQPQGEASLVGIIAQKNKGVVGRF